MVAVCGCLPLWFFQPTAVPTPLPYLPVILLCLCLPVVSLPLPCLLPCICPCVCLPSPTPGPVTCHVHVACCLQLLPSLPSGTFCLLPRGSWDCALLPTLPGLLLQLPCSRTALCLPLPPGATLPCCACHCIVLPGCCIVP